MTIKDNTNIGFTYWMLTILVSVVEFVCVYTMALMSRAFYFAIFLIIVSPLFIKRSTNNTCTSNLDYFLINFSENCYYNPDVDLESHEVIEKYTKNLNIYNVTSNDGYISTLYRINRRNPRGVVLLLPPVLASSFIWVMNGNQSLPFRLWNKGYDVWLANPRGSVYARTHVNLSDSDSSYYNYSFHEIAMFEVDFQIDLIRNKTNNSQIILIGYSSGSTEALVYASMKPGKAHEYIKAIMLIAPAAILEGSTSLLKYYTQICKFFEFILGSGEIMLAELFNLFSFLTFTPSVINMLEGMHLGGTISGVESVLYPFFINKVGNGITFKLSYHFAQLYSKNTFLMYDYGIESNRLLYGSDQPPNYPLQNIRTPLYIIYGQNDTITGHRDIVQQITPEGGGLWNNSNS